MGVGTPWNQPLAAKVSLVVADETLSSPRILMKALIGNVARPARVLGTFLTVRAGQLASVALRIT